MPLPFLKDKRQTAGLIMEYRKPDGGSEQEPEGQEDHALEACAEAAIRAMTAKDASALAKAWRDAYTILGSEEQPSAEEGEEDV